MDLSIFEPGASQGSKQDSSSAGPKFYSLFPYPTTSKSEQDKYNQSNPFPNISEPIRTGQTSSKLDPIGTGRPSSKLNPKGDGQTIPNLNPIFRPSSVLMQTETGRPFSTINPIETGHFFPSNSPLSGPYSTLLNPIRGEQTFLTLNAIRAGQQYPTLNPIGTAQVFLNLNPTAPRQLFSTLNPLGIRQPFPALNPPGQPFSTLNPMGIRQPLPPTPIRFSQPFSTFNPFGSGPNQQNNYGPNPILNGYNPYNYDGNPIWNGLQFIQLYRNSKNKQNSSGDNNNMNNPSLLPPPGFSGPNRSHGQNQPPMDKREYYTVQEMVGAVQGYNNPTYSNPQTPPVVYGAIQRQRDGNYRNGYEQRVPANIYTPQPELGAVPMNNYETSIVMYNNRM